MGQTNKKKTESREARLKLLPQSERLLKTALIKKKEGRVMDAAEKHAIKMSSEHGEILRLWEKLRTSPSSEKEENKSVAQIKSTVYEHKYPVVDKLLELIEPKFMAHVRTPVISRVLQSMVKYGSQTHVERVAALLIKDFLTCTTDAYGHFVVMAVIRHANRDVFTKLLNALIPIVPQAVSHKFGVHVLHCAYSSRWSTSSDRDRLCLGVFKYDPSAMKRWVGYPAIEDVVQNNPDIQKHLLTRLFDLVEKLISQKESIGFPFVQRLAFAFLKAGTREEVSELCDTIRPHCAAIAVTREGALLSSLTFSLTHPKKKKEILRDFKERLGELSIGKYSAPVVARFFDLLYDIQLMNKYIANDSIAHIGQLINNEYGYRIMMHLLTPHASRKERYLLPNWMEHNLFSLENTKWNRHTWLTGDYEQEEVEICSKPALNSHLQVLPAFVSAFLSYARDEKNAAKLNRQHAGLLAREILRVNSEEPRFCQALDLKPKDLEFLQRLSPASGVKRDREELVEKTDGAMRKHPKKEKKTSSTTRHLPDATEERRRKTTKNGGKTQL
eukprot:gene9236-6489_t